MCVSWCHRDSVNLFNQQDTLVGSVSWDDAIQGASLMLLPDETYKQIPGDKNVVDTLELMGFETMAEALKVSGAQVASYL